MPFLLSVISGPAGIGTGVPVPDDRAVTIGRHSGLVDFPIQLDAALSKRHFEIRGGEKECLLRDLGSTGGTFVNDEKVAEKTVRVGDEIRAGSTRFRIERTDLASAESATDVGCDSVGPLPVPPTPAGAMRTSASTTVPRSTPPPAPLVPLSPAPFEAPSSTSVVPPPVRDEGVGYRPLRASELIAAEATEIGDAARAQVAESDSIPDLLEKLRAAPDLLLDALRLAAHALPRRKAVWWACRCLRAELPEPTERDVAALSAAEDWVRTGTETDRRRAEQAAIALEYATAPAWAATAAFWSGPTLAPDNVPAVPPAPDLGARAVRGAVMLAAVAQRPELAPERHARFLDLAQRIAEDPRPWGP